MNKQLLFILFSFALILSLTNATQPPKPEEEPDERDEPPYFCKMQVKSNEEAHSEYNIVGNQANLFRFKNLRFFKSANCACVAIVFSGNNFQGKFSTVNIGSEWVSVPFNARSIMVTCGAGFDNVFEQEKIEGEN